MESKDSKTFTKKYKTCLIRATPNLSVLLMLPSQRETHVLGAQKIRLIILIYLKMFVWRAQIHISSNPVIILAPDRRWIPIHQLRIIMEIYLIQLKVHKLVPVRLPSLTELAVLDVIHQHSLILLQIYAKNALKTQHLIHQLTFVFIKSGTQIFLHK